MPRILQNMDNDLSATVAYILNNVQDPGKREIQLKALLGDSGYEEVMKDQHAENTYIEPEDVQLIAFNRSVFGREMFTFLDAILHHVQQSNETLGNIENKMNHFEQEIASLKSSQSQMNEQVVELKRQITEHRAGQTQISLKIDEQASLQQSLQVKIGELATCVEKCAEYHKDSKDTLDAQKNSLQGLKASIEDIAKKSFDLSLVMGMVQSDMHETRKKVLSIDSMAGTIQCVANQQLEDNNELKTKLTEVDEHLQTFNRMIENFQRKIRELKEEADNQGRRGRFREYFTIGAAGLPSLALLSLIFAAATTD